MSDYKAIIESVYSSPHFSYVPEEDCKCHAHRLMPAIAALEQQLAEAKASEAAAISRFDSYSEITSEATVECAKLKDELAEARQEIATLAEANQIKYPIELLPDEETGAWCALHPTLPGCIAQGDTILEALQSLSDSRELWIESVKESGQEIPAPYGDGPSHELHEAKKKIRTMQQELERVKLKWQKYEDYLLAHGAMNQPPCFICGYNGENYYQPEIHPCAARHHKLFAIPEPEEKE